MGQRYNCRKCNKAIPDRRSSSEELDICRHCFSKMEYGVSDPKTCFQGSVITLEDWWLNVTDVEENFFTMSNGISTLKPMGFVVDVQTVKPRCLNGVTNEMEI